MFLIKGGVNALRMQRAEQNQKPRPTYLSAFSNLDFIPFTIPPPSSLLFPFLPQNPYLGSNIPPSTPQITTNQLSRALRRRYTTSIKQRRRGAIILAEIEIHIRT